MELETTTVVVGQELAAGTCGVGRLETRKFKRNGLEKSLRNAGLSDNRIGHELDGLIGNRLKLRIDPRLRAAPMRPRRTLSQPTTASERHICAQRVKGSPAIGCAIIRDRGLLLMRSTPRSTAIDTPIHRDRHPIHCDRHPRSTAIDTPIHHDRHPDPRRSTPRSTAINTPIGHDHASIVHDRPSGHPRSTMRSCTMGVSITVDRCLLLT